jgi:hypothetical protein
MSQNTPTERVELRTAQKQNLEILGKNFGLSDAELNRCLFFEAKNDEPWIPPDILEAIARKTGGFQTISSTYDQFIELLNQIVYGGLVVDAQGRSFPRSGVATIGERPGGIEIDAHTLAEGRALSASLTAAGFNPFRAGSVVDLADHRTPTHSGPPLNETEKQLHGLEDEGTLRRKDLAQIHALATEKKLIVGKDLTRYREWLLKFFFTKTAATLTAGSRASVIEALNKLDETDAYLFDVPEEFRSEALIA